MTIIIFLNQGLALVLLLNNLQIILTSTATCFISLVQISVLHILFPMCQLAITLSTFTSITPLLFHSRLDTYSTNHFCDRLLIGLPNPCLHILLITFSLFVVIGFLCVIF